jgi:hypothetical protein
MRIRVDRMVGIRIEVSLRMVYERVVGLGERMELERQNGG